MNKKAFIYSGDVIKARSVSHELPTGAVRRAYPDIEFDSAVSLLIILDSFVRLDEPDDRTYDVFEYDELLDKRFDNIFAELLVPGVNLRYAQADTEAECRNLRSVDILLEDGPTTFNYALSVTNPLRIDIACSDLYLKTRTDGVARRHAAPPKGRLLWNLRDAQVLSLYTPERNVAVRSVSSLVAA